MEREDILLIKYKFESGVYSLRLIFQMVEDDMLTPEEFHFITSFDYYGIKENRGW
jgi:hypothetical protein